MDSFEKTQTGFNQKLDNKNNKVDEVLEVLKGGVEINQKSDKNQVTHNKNNNFKQTQEAFRQNNNDDNYGESQTYFKKTDETTTNFKNPEELFEDSRYKPTNSNNNLNRIFKFRSSKPRSEFNKQNKRQ